ncbi:hypothetical protein JZ751_017667 [Albula glossodonta]|uniref:BHLH domain-containing protein n=1 Tax=Albula glossodonta TaxID=121402 RepID=A0A8T2PMK1_9TELE|nr:hypothetical protein JZ751_017667 [Albula glossodonta]
MQEILSTPWDWSTFRAEGVCSMSLPPCLDIKRGHYRLRGRQSNPVAGVTMNTGFSHGFVERRPGLLSGGGLQYGMMPPSGHPEHRHRSTHLHPSGDALPHTVPFLLYPANVDTGLYEGSYRGGPPLFPYLPAFHGHFGVYECPFEPAFIQKRNERERQRVKCVNQGYAKLRDHLPGGAGDKRLSKVETLRAAIRYIKYLQGLVGDSTCSSPKATSLSLEDSGHSDGESPHSVSESSSPGLYCGDSGAGILLVWQQLNRLAISSPM